jgi:DNA-binding response OmpR family regulator
MSILSGRTILVVEDEPLIAYLMEEVFTSAGAKVEIALTLNRALAYLDEDRDTAVAVLDYCLPDGNCLPICDRLLARDTPFMICSGLGTVEGSARSAVQLSKPVPLDDLVPVAEDLVRASSKPKSQLASAAA